MAFSSAEEFIYLYWLFSTFQVNVGCLIHYREALLYRACQAVWEFLPRAILARKGLPPYSKVKGGRGGGTLGLVYR